MPGIQTASVVACYQARGQTRAVEQLIGGKDKAALTAGHYDPLLQQFVTQLDHRFTQGGSILAIGGGTGQHHKARILPLAHRITVSFGPLAVEVVELTLPGTIVGERLLQGHQLVVDLDGDDGRLLVPLAIDDKTDLLV